MAEKKQVSVGVDGSEVLDFQKSIRESAKEMSRGMIQDARAYTTSAKEVNNYLREQISLMEKRSQLDKEFRENELRSQAGKGEISQGVMKKGIQEAREAYNEDKLQTKLLKDIFDAIRQTSEKEIREDRQSVEKQLAQSRTVNVLAPEGDEADIYKETLQQERLQSIKDQEVQQRGQMDPRLFGAPMDFVSMRDPFQAMSGMASTGSGLFKNIGGVGGVMGMVGLAGIAKLISSLGQSTMDLESSLGEASVLTGMSVRGAGDYVKGLDATQLSRYGLTPSDFIRRSTAFRMGSRTSNYGEDALNLMSIAGGTTLSEQDVTSLVSLRRFGATGTASGTTAFFENYLKRTSQDISVLPEIIQQFTNEARIMISQTGGVNSTDIASIIYRVGEQTGLKGEALGGAMGALRQGFQRSSNPVVQAMQFRAASEVMGEGATLWDLEKVMADPFSNPEYMSQMLSKLRTSSGGGQGYERAISNVFGVNPIMAARLAKLDLTEKLDAETLNMVKEGSVSYHGKLAKTVGAGTEATAYFEGSRQQLSFKTMEKAAGLIMDAVKSFEEYIQDLKLFQEESMEEERKMWQFLKTERETISAGGSIFAGGGKM
jgi:hypothetical protein